jgi:hypothetical protein
LIRAIYLESKQNIMVAKLYTPMYNYKCFGADAGKYVLAS